ncbi:ABC transporter ATP-binding protein [Jannaschia sp. R86511]|uniref:ABC transporter ATP-binding protein n=1 Tax=Jannaschia sp. R86511 TaxID=3093853 RepID=UPI0036D278B8
MTDTETGTREATALTTPTVVLDAVEVDYRVSVEGSGPRGRARTEHVRAVDGVTAVIRRGEAVGVLGRNGSGKSTLLRAVAGLTRVTAGHVWAASTPTLLGVNAAMMPNLSGTRNILLGCMALGMSRREIKDRMQDIVDFSGLGEAVHRPMRTYSSGMGSRLRFAIATARVPDILLIDEALNTGDADFKERSEQRIRELRAEAGTVMLVSHSLSAIAGTCSRSLWMDGGTLRMDGPTDEVVAAYTEHNKANKAWRAGKGARPTLPGPVVGVDAEFRPVSS